MIKIINKLIANYKIKGFETNKSRINYKVINKNICKYIFLFVQI